MAGSTKSHKKTGTKSGHGTTTGIIVLALYALTYFAYHAGVFH